MLTRADMSVLQSWIFAPQPPIPQLRETIALAYAQAEAEYQQYHYRCNFCGKRFRPIDYGDDTVLWKERSQPDPLCPECYDGPAKDCILIDWHSLEHPAEHFIMTNLELCVCILNKNELDEDDLTDISIYLAEVEELLEQ